MLSSRYLKYSYDFSAFAFAVSAKLYSIALDFAPPVVAIICQLCLPTQNFFMLRSASYLDIKITSRAGNQAVLCWKEKLEVN